VSLSFRSRVEHRSAPAVERLNALPRVVPFLGLLALMVPGIFLPRVGFLATGAVGLFVCWLLFLTWPRLTPPEKLLRLAVLLLVTALTVVQAFPRG
jgi:hypothetical protein